MVVLAENDRDIGRRLRSQVEAAISGSDERVKQRNQAWNLYWLKDEAGGVLDGSAIHSPDVNSMVTAVQSQLNVAYNNKQLASFPANGPDDEPQAQAESRVCNKVFGDSAGYQTLSSLSWNALMFGTTVGKVWWDEDITRYRVTHNNVDKAQVPVLIDESDGQERRLLGYDPDKKTARVEVTETKKRLRLGAVQTDRWFMTPEWDSMDLQTIPLCGEVHYSTRNELSRMGVKWSIVKDLQAVQRASGQETSNVSRPQQNTAAAVEPIVFQMDVVRWYEVYAWLSFDADEDRAYLYKCKLTDAATSSGEDWLLPPEQVARVPYAAGAVFPTPGQFWGQAEADKVAPIQYGKTVKLRQWDDNVANCSFGRFGVVVGQADAGDVNTPKAGGAVRLKSPTAIVPIPVIDVGPSIAASLEYYDKMRTEAGGAAVDMIGAEMEVAGDTAHGMERQMTAKEQITSLMARNLEPMVEQLFLLVHAELRDGDGGPINMKVADTWQTVDPAQWPARTQCQIKVGYSMGERSRMAQTLGAGLQMYTAAMQNGLAGEFVSMQGLYKMSVDWLTLNMIDDAEAYFIDPASEAAQQAGAAKQQQAQQLAQEQNAANERLIALPEQIKAQVNNLKSERDTWTEVFKAILQAGTQAHAAEVQGASDVSRAGIEAKAITAANAGGAGGAGNGSNKRSANGSGKPGGKRQPGGSNKAGSAAN